MKCALVTGSTKGIGFATAKKLADNGYLVYVNGRSDAPEFFASDRRFIYIKADLSTMAGVDILFESVENRLLNCLILNAGATCRKPMSEIEYDDWQSVMDTNVNIPFFITQRFKENMHDNGSITFISSALSLWPHATSVPYGVSKAAVNMLAQTLVKEFSNKKIRVNAICPGFIDTLWQKEKPQELREKIAKKTALNRFGTPEEVADMCFSIINNSYMNGSIVSLDGGYDYV